MAKSSRTSMPVDVPAVLGGGVVYKERGIFSDESPNRGFYAGFGDSSGQFTAKGDRRQSMSEPRDARVSFKLKGK